jgi:Mg-chelatase subunit ChlI
VNVRLRLTGREGGGLRQEAERAIAALHAERERARQQQQQQQQQQELLLQQQQQQQQQREREQQQQEAAAAAAAAAAADARQRDEAAAQRAPTGATLPRGPLGQGKQGPLNADLLETPASVGPPPAPEPPPAPTSGPRPAQQEAEALRAQYQVRSVASRPP